MESTYRREWEIEPPTQTKSPEFVNFLQEIPIASGFQFQSTQKKKLKIIYSIRISFFFGIFCVLGMLLSFILLNFWAGLMFIPAIIGTYGLFLSSGKQLADMERTFFIEMTLNATPSV